VTHWQHPRFHAYFPAGNCYPSIIGELLSAGLGTVNFSWAASPSCTELETIVLDWLGKMINLPGVFLPFFHKKELIPASSPLETNNNGNVNGNGNGEINGHSSHNGKSESDQDDACFDDPPSSGGGVILGSASECVLVSLLSARTDMLRKLKAKHPFVEDGVLLSKLVMYTSKLAHSCVEKAGVIAMVKIRLLNTDENYSLRGSELEKAVKDDRSNGLIPFFVSATFGTTSCCSFDNVKEIGQYCHKEEIYLHVDGAYAGSALICEEFRGYLEGLEVDHYFF
jgi:tyrosine decarboxylase